MRTGRLGRAFGASFVVHGLVLLAVVVAIGTRSMVVVREPPPADYKVVFALAPGPGGGGGGNPAPAPPRRLEIPRPVDQIPVAFEPLDTDVPPPLPTLMAPVYVSSASVVQASGQNLISLTPLGGGGAGGSVGDGRGPGVGSGERGGFGGGQYGEGTPGFVPARLLRAQRPDYTGDAMRAKIQGEVELEVVILPNGTVGDARIVTSLDSRFGLDQEAIKAAKLWLFYAATLHGVPVESVARIVLSFRLH